MSAHTIRALREGSPHLGTAISGKELHLGPFLVDLPAQEIQVELLVTQTFTNADDAFDRRVPVVDSMFLGILDESEDERRYAENCIGLDATDGIPLQFRDAVPHTDDARPQFTDSQEIRQSCHEPFIEGSHQLQNTPRFQSCALKRFLLVQSQSLEIVFRTTKRHRITQGSAGGDVVNNLFFGTAEEVLIEEL